jgi:threonine/homoserine/homoserine lactone efflux protein
VRLSITIEASGVCSSVVIRVVKSMRFGWPQLYILFGAITAGKALHWFLTPAAHTGLAFEHVAVAIQAVAGALLFWLGARQSRRSTAADANPDHGATSVSS